MPTVRVSGGVELDESDYEYLKDLGEKVATTHNISALQELKRFFEDNDAFEKADELDRQMASAIDGVTQDAYNATGQNISYYPNLYGGAGGWRNDDSGYFIGKLGINIDVNNPQYQDDLAKRVLVGQ